MKKIDTTVKNETINIALFSTVLSLFLQSVLLIVGLWDYTVLLGNLLGLSAAVGNFLLMGLTVQKAILKPEADAKKLIKASQQLRLFGMLVIALIGYLLPIFNIFAVVIPYLFPRITIALRPTVVKKGDCFERQKP